MATGKGKTNSKAKAPAKKRKRKCHGKNQQGKPCGAPPFKPGTIVKGIKVSGKWCSRHDEDLPENARIGGAQPGAGRPRKPRVVDVMREKLEENIDLMIDPYLQQALQAVNRIPKVIDPKTGEITEWEEIPDYKARIAAVEKLLDRGYGKPGQALELTGRDGNPIEVDALAFTDPTVRKAADEYARRVGNARADGTSGSRSGD